MTDIDRLIDDIERRLAVLRQQREAALHRLGNLDGQIQALAEVLAGLTAPAPAEEARDAAA